MFVYDDACLGDDESRCLSELVRLLRDELVKEPDWLSCKLLLLLGFACDMKCLCGRSFGLVSSWCTMLLMMSFVIASARAFISSCVNGLIGGSS